MRALFTVCYLVVILGCADTTTTVLIIEDPQELTPPDPHITTLGYGYAVYPALGFVYYDFKSGDVLIHREGKEIARYTYRETNTHNNRRTFSK